MNFDKQWKKKSTNNRRLFVEKDSSNKERSKDEGKLPSLIILNEHTETEAFSLRLSESYVDETQESTNLKINSKVLNEIISISDSSSSNESIFSYSKSSRKSEIKKKCYMKQNFKSSGNECLNTPFQNVNFKIIENKQAVIHDSDSELEQGKLPELIRETVVESVTLSNRKKKEILKWLNNFDISRCGSSCSQDSAITDSRKSGLSSGNSSLERLELNFETPNNRGKISKERLNKIDYKNSNQQNKEDNYFTISKKCQLDIIKDKTPNSEYSDQTPVNRSKVHVRNIISNSEIFDLKTSCSKNSNGILSNKKKNSIEIIKTELDHLNTTKNSSFISGSNHTKLTSSKKIMLKSKHNDSDIFPEIDSDKSLKTKEISNLKKIIVETESDSSGSEIYKSRNSLELLKISKKIIIPESQSFESSDISNRTTSKEKSKENKLILDITEDLSELEGINEFQLDEKHSNQPTANTTLKDCADILENLYGATWRNKVNTLVTNSEPKKRTNKIICKKPQSEKKKVTSKKQQFNLESNKNKVSNKENEFYLPKRISQTTIKKTKTKTKLKNSFINDESTTESSPDCSFYTALSNPVSFHNNYFKPQTISTRKESSRINQERILEICDSESDMENDVWNNRGINQRKLDFNSSSSSSTSEFDPEDLVPPKSTIKGIKKYVSEGVTKKIQETDKDVRKSFLASLSKDVLLENADFKAMVYRVKYSTMKEELCRVLYKLFNEKVFENKLPNDMSIEWSARLRGTAGKCYNKQSLKALGKTVRSSRIVLASKILDSPDRLRDTLIHEMCHAATWLINNVSDGHGSFWKAWANKAVKVFSELPPISRCHNYEIQTKYTYKCTSCGYSIGRHSKSLDLNRKRCGFCHGKFELLINKLTKMGNVQKKSTSQTKEPSGFALFVKENYQLVKQSGAAVKHGDVMKILSQKFSAIKITPKSY